MFTFEELYVINLISSDINLPETINSWEKIEADFFES